MNITQANDPRQTVWLAVQVFAESDDRPWNMEIVGAFETEDEAVKACKAENYCIGPLTLGKISPTETTEWPGAYYPLHYSSEGRE